MTYSEKEGNLEIVWVNNSYAVLFFKKGYGFWPEVFKTLEAHSFRSVDGSTLRGLCESISEVLPEQYGQRLIFATDGCLPSHSLKQQTLHQDTLSVCWMIPGDGPYTRCFPRGFVGAEGLLVKRKES